MHKLVQHVKTTIVERQLLQPCQKVLVAVSGGVDSMVLLHVLAELADEFAWQLAVAHFNHNLRGQDAESDQKLVQHTAGQLHLKCICGRADVRQFATRHKLSIELAARMLRHKFLARTARRLGIRTIALGHHADDQIELFFVRLFRGTGGAGLAGMRWCNPSPVDSQIDLVRPLLDQPKTVLIQYAKAHKIPFREDTTNYSIEYLRNRVRNLLLPWLARHFGTGFVKTIPRMMELVGAESDFVATAAARWLAARRKPAFEKLPIAVQRQSIVIQLLDRGVAPDFDLVEQLRVHKDRPVNVSAELSVVRNRTGKIRTAKHQSAASAKPQFSQEKKRISFGSRAGEVNFASLKLRWRIIQRKAQVRFSLPDKVEMFDADKVGPGAILRHWQPGDRFQPIGMHSPVKLQDIFTNLKIPKPQRHRLVVAQTLDGEVFWVEGVRIGERFKLDNQTRRLLRWTWRRL